jgi:putative flavoprotein involved in K+ transport
MRHPRCAPAHRRFVADPMDSLQLFTPAYLNALPGMEFPGPQTRCSTKDEMADYLEAYAARFGLSGRHPGS